MMHQFFDQYEDLCSCVIIRNAPQSDPDSRISSLSLFTVSKGGGGVKFRVTHERFDAADDQCAIFATLRNQIPSGAQLIVRQPPNAPWILMKIAAGDTSLPLLDNQKIARALPEVTLLPLHVDDNDLQASGNALGLDMPTAFSTPLKRHRRAPLHAMALWAIYVRAFYEATEANALIAAFQAWHVLERVKPVRSSRGVSPRKNSN
jgi:hypothetical protein